MQESGTIQTPAVMEIARVAAAQDALDLVPPKLARALKALPVAVEARRLIVCVADAEDDAVRARIESLHPELETVLVAADDAAALDRALRENYPDALLRGELDEPANFFTYLLRRALARGASDIHLSPDADGMRVRFRVDGRLRTDRRLTGARVEELVSYIKVISHLDISERRAPQDGAIDLTLDGAAVSLRTAIVPTIHGEHVTLRLLAGSRAEEKLETLDDLGLHPRQSELLRAALRIPNGVIVSSGPTGSGKTTTLYAALRALVAQDRGGRHVVSIEDPVERPVAGVTQIKVDSKAERVSFATALRSVLRHDPDVVMIGEIRDGETAATALRSALTGHLVLTTLHTNSAPGILSRLTDLGVPSYLVAATLRLVIAQRLVRRPCRRCMEWVTADEAVCRANGWPTDGTVRIPRARGCPYCAQTGYAGRTAIYEMLPVTDEIREMVQAGKGESEIYRLLKTRDLDLTLRGDGLARVLEGETTLEELDATVAYSF